MAKRHGTNNKDGPKRKMSYGWIGGAVLIALGIIFLLARSETGMLSGNWWAAFIYIPAGVILAQAFSIYRMAGKFDREVIGRLVVGVFVGILATMFLLDRSVNRYWPAFLIAAGAGFLLTTLLKK